MTRDTTHMDQVERWAHFVRDHPKEWRRHHTAFINGMFEKSHSFIESLAKTVNGREKIVKLYRITNTKGYARLLALKDSQKK